MKYWLRRFYKGHGYVWETVDRKEFEHLAEILGFNFKNEIGFQFQYERHGYSAWGLIMADDSILVGV